MHFHYLQISKDRFDKPPRRTSSLLLLRKATETETMFRGDQSQSLMFSQDILEVHARLQRSVPAGLSVDGLATASLRCRSLNQALVCERLPLILWLSSCHLVTRAAGEDEGDPHLSLFILPSLSLSLLSFNRGNKGGRK